MARHFDNGETVRIVSPEEYRRRGGSFTDNCAFVLYSGSICKVDRKLGDGYRLFPIETQMNIQFDATNHLEIKHYLWQDSQLDPYEDHRDYVDEKDFCDIF